MGEGKVNSTFSCSDTCNVLSKLFAAYEALCLGGQNELGANGCDDKCVRSQTTEDKKDVRGGFQRAGAEFQPGELAADLSA